MIIAIKEKDRIVVGYSNADSLTGYSDETILDEENIALKFAPNGNLFGFVNAERVSDLLLSDDGLMKEEITPKIIVKDIIPFIKDIAGIDSESNEWNNIMTICSNNHIYDVDKFFEFREVKDYVCHACGGGWSFLRSVLDVTTDLPAEERIIKAVKFSNKLQKRNFFPLIITDTKTKVMKRIYEGEN